jgi:hypothetical protein
VVKIFVDMSSGGAWGEAADDDELPPWPTSGGFDAMRAWVESAELACVDVLRR